MIFQDEPDQSGLYVAYINSDFTDKYADRKLLMWYDGQWTYPMSDQRFRGHVYECLGPLPTMELKDE